MFALMKKPISFLLTILLSAAMVRYSVLFALGVAQADVHSIDFCDMPVISLLPLCKVASTPPSHTSSVARADFPTLMAIQHRALDELSMDSVGGSELVLNIKHAELAVRDLVIMVKSSNLTSKDALADVLTEFLLDAHQAARDLQMFSSKVYGIMDK